MGLGTSAWRNWHAYNDNEPEIEYLIDELHSTVAFHGAPVSFGPYELTPVWRDDQPIEPTAPQRVGQSLLLRYAIHTDLMPDLVKDGDLTPTDSSGYFGGHIADEIAALVALSLGVPLRSAGARLMSGIRYPGEPEPTLMVREVRPLSTPQSDSRQRLPRLRARPTNLTGLDRLAKFPNLSRRNQVKLVLAARSYASGVWIADEDPNMAWLNLVTAVEVAADQAIRVKTAPIDLVRDLWPELWMALEPAPEQVRHDVAAQLSQQIKATQKFITFLSTYAPDPPSKRPEWDRFEWATMPEASRLIYKHRSNALHGGKPFPMPMLDAPRTFGGEPQETPGGLTSGGAGASWAAAEMPMLLATFEYIAHGALLRWWDQLTPGGV